VQNFKDRSRGSEYLFPQKTDNIISSQDIDFQNVMTPLFGT